METETKILICEDNENMAKGLASAVRQLGYASCLLFKENPQHIVDSVESVLKEEYPDYALVGGLDGEYIKVVQKVVDSPYNTVPVIFSFSDNLINGAKNLGYDAFNKTNFKGLMAFIEKREVGKVEVIN